MSDAQFTDEDLTAYLDGELEGEKTALLESALSQDLSLSHRLASLDFPLDRLHKEAKALSDNVSPFQMPSASSSSSKVWLVAASLALGTVIGAGAMRLAEAPDTWVDAVASYQALYVPATLSGAMQPSDISTAVISAFEADTGVSLEGVTELKGLTFKRAQTLGIGGHMLLQLAYVTDDGTPVAYCLTSVEDVDRQATASTSHGLQAVDWVRNGTGFILIGDLSKEQLLTLQVQLPGA